MFQRQLRSSGIARAAGAVLVVAFAVTGCTSPDDLRNVALPAESVPGQPAGTIELTAGTDPAQVVQRLQDAITAAGGTVTTVVDHTAEAAGLGVQIPANTVVVGSPAAAGQALIGVDQDAGANLPARYLVRQEQDGSVSLTAEGPKYIAAVSGVAAPEASVPMTRSTSAVLAQAAAGAPVPTESSLVAVTPANYLQTVFGSASVPATVDRLRRAADAPGSRSVAAVDLVAGANPPLRPTSVVLVSIPEAEAPLLAAAPSIGLDLPLRFVVWLDDQNRTQIGHPDLARIAARHGVATNDPNIARLAADADRIARRAAGLIND